VRHPPPEEKDQTIAVVSPCGACRELIFDYDRNARVIVPGPDPTVPRKRGGKASEPAVASIGDLLPNKYKRGPER
jgi:cytidine deaminase